MSPVRSARASASRRRGATRADMRSALVLQGGAALGAYEAGVLKALLESQRRIEVVTGCSIGALMAAIFVGSRGDPAVALDDLWRRFAMPVNPFVPGLFARSLPLPGGDNVYRANPTFFTMPMLATHMYEADALRAAVEQWIDFDKLAGAHAELIVTAVEVGSGRLAEFSSRDGLRAEHILASASLPPVFPATAIGRAAYWDGGLIANTPLRPALNAIEAHNRADRARRWELVVVDLFAPSAAPPKDMTDVLQRAFELLFFGRFQHDMKLFEAMNEQLDLLTQLDQALPATSPLKKHPAYLKLKRHRRVDRLTVIRTPKPEALGGPADFSADAIAHRMRLGYRDAQRALARR